MEALQYPLAARSADLFDAAANTVGTAVGLGVWTATWRIASAVVETATADSVG
jgi:glycopeptide antibiotics resistance protein